MIGLIPRPLHAALDYAWGILFTFAPEIFGYADDEKANLYSKVRGGSMIGISMLTRFELGLIKIIPFNLHLLFDLMGALGGLISPQALGFDKNKAARNAVLAFSLFELGAVLLSKRDK